MRIAQMKIRTKLWLAVATIVALLISLLVFSAGRTARLTAEGAKVIAESNARVDLANKWAALTETNAARTQALILSGEPAVHEAMAQAIATTSARIGDLQKDLESRDLSTADREQMRAIATTRQAMLGARDQAQKLRADGNADEAINFVRGPYAAAVDAYLGELRKFVSLQESNLRANQEAAAAARMTTVKISGGGAILVLLIIIGGAAALIRSISEPLKRATELARHIAAGDLTQRFSVKRTDEIGDLQRALLNMCDSLEQMVMRVRENTDTIDVTSREIAAGYTDLSNRTERSAAELSRAASTTSDFTRQVGETGDAAGEAAALARHASGAAQRGGSVVTEVVSTMNDISESSRKISDIIGVIDGIAFQTNILALNAAVEAARAGEQGRGFAVVASEVRSLAGRSAQAAHEIKDLIVASVAKIESGTALVTNAGTTMDEIVSSVQKVTDMIGRFTAIAQQQSQGVAGINQAVDSVDRMTQQNAALVEQGAAAAQSMREQARQLAQLVQVFQVRSAMPAVRPAAPPAPKPAVSANRAVATQPPATSRAVQPARAPIATIDPPAALPGRTAAPRLAAPSSSRTAPQAAASAVARLAAPQRPAQDALAAAVLPRHAPQYQQRAQPPQLTQTVTGGTRPARTLVPGASGVPARAVTPAAPARPTPGALSATPRAAPGAGAPRTASSMAAAASRAGTVPARVPGAAPAAAPVARAVPGAPVAASAGRPGVNVTQAARPATAVRPASAASAPARTNVAPATARSGAAPVTARTPAAPVTSRPPVAPRTAPSSAATPRR